MKTINPYTLNYTSQQIRTGNRIVKPDIIAPAIGTQVLTTITSRFNAYLHNDYTLMLDLYCDWYFSTEKKSSISIDSAEEQKPEHAIITLLDNPVIQTPKKYGIVFYNTIVNGEIVPNCSGIRIKCMDNSNELKEYEEIPISDSEVMTITSKLHNDRLYDNFSQCKQLFDVLILEKNYIQAGNYNYCLANISNVKVDKDITDIYNVLYEHITFVPSNYYKWEQHNNFYMLTITTNNTDTLMDIEVRVNNSVMFNQFKTDKNNNLIIYFPTNIITNVDDISVLIKYIKKVGRK